MACLKRLQKGEFFNVHTTNGQHTPSGLLCLATSALTPHRRWSTAMRRLTKVRPVFPKRQAIIDEMGNVEARKGSLMVQRIYLSRRDMFPTTGRVGLNGDDTRKSRRQTTALILSFTGAVLFLDLLAPLGIPYWLLYSVPFFFIRYDNPRHFALILAMLCTILMLVGYAVSPGGNGEPMTHRASAAIIVWIVVIALTR
jgi:hypothetical protein